jgi:hypothetical protein
MRRLLLATLATVWGFGACAQNLSGNYPPNSIAVGNSNAGTTGAVVATLPAAQSRLTLISGFEVTEINPTAAAAITVTVAGLAGGSWTYTIQTLATAATVPNPPPLIVELPLPFPASGINTSITVTASAAGAGGVANVTAHGYQQLVQ